MFLPFRSIFRECIQTEKHVKEMIRRDYHVIVLLFKNYSKQGRLNE